MNSKRRRDARKRLEGLRQRQEVAGPRSAETAIANAKGKISIQVPNTKLGTPGVPREAYAVAGPAPGVPGDEGHAAVALGDRSEREFHVVVHLGKQV